MYHLKWPLASSVCVYLFLSPACLCLKDRSSINQSVHLHCLVKFRYFVLNKRVLSKWRNKINTGCLGNYNRFTHSGKQNQGPPLSHQKVLPEVWHIPPAMANMHFFWFHTQWLLKADATSWMDPGFQQDARKTWDAENHQSYSFQSFSLLPSLLLRVQKHWPISPLPAAVWKVLI